MSRRGFTLIEALIAVTLSLALISGAFAGVRLAAQSVSLANRLAIENSLIRAGYSAAVDEADFWRDYDDPDDATRQQLRGFKAGVPWNRGMPFTPFDATTMPSSGTRGADNERGWDPDYQWPASDTRTWFHGNLVEMVGRTNHVFGHYELFAHHQDAPRLDRIFPNGVAFASAGDVKPVHTWMCNELESVKNALGYYGVVEYMPANQIYGVVGEPGGDNAYGTGDDDDQSLEREWCEPSGSGGGNNFRFANDDGGTAWPRGIYRVVRDSTFPIIPASPFTTARTNAWPLDALVTAQFRSWATDRVSDASDTSPGNHGIADLVTKADMTMPMLPVRPSAWPGVTRSVMRYLNNSRFVCLAKIRWTSPITGETSELSFTTIATSLRGARQQRSPTAGWAAPGQPNLDKP